MYIARWLNGHSDSNIDLNDRGLAYGDGLFETVAIFCGKMPFLDLHFKRLEDGCKRLSLDCDLKLLRMEVGRVVSEINWALWPRASLKIMLTREAGGRGYYPKKNAKTNRIIFLLNYIEPDSHYYEQGVNTRICNTPCSHNPVLAGMKHISRLENVLARAEWDLEFFEGFMLDLKKNVIEGTMSNVFLIKNKKLQTPLLNNCGVNGVMRQFIIDTLAPENNIDVEEATISVKDLLAADEIFITNSLLGIYPVSDIESHIKLVGPVTKQLRNALNTFIDRNI